MNEGGGNLALRRDMDMDEQTQLLDWMDALCERASEDLRKGDPGLLNSLSQNRALAAYYNNVHKLRSIPREAFPYWYPGFFTEAKMVKAQYDALDTVTEQTTRIDALEDKLEKLAGMIEKLVEAQERPVKTTKRGKKRLTEEADVKGEDEPDAAEDQDEEEANPPAESAAEEDVKSDEAE